MLQWRRALLGLGATLVCCSQAAPVDGPVGLASDERFGVILLGGPPDDILRLLGFRWYQDYGYSAKDIPNGFRKAMKVRSNVFPPSGEIQAAARAAPGSHWLIGNEPNVPGQDDVTPEAYIESFHYYRTAIKQADPTALIVAPEILNMDFTCRGCAGFASGREWLDRFRQAYQTRFQQEPPIDVWSIHTYDLNWEQLPQGDHQIQIEQILEFRRYLDAIPGQREKPIWLTEFSVIWPYDGVRWEERGGTHVAHAEGTYRVDRLRDYVQAMVGWLRSNAEGLKLERWFIFASHATAEPWSAAPEGVGLVDGNGAAARLTPLGRLYREMAGAAARE